MFSSVNYQSEHTCISHPSQKAPSLSFSIIISLFLSEATAIITSNMCINFNYFKILCNEVISMCFLFWLLSFNISVKIVFPTFTLLNYYKIFQLNYNWKYQVSNNKTGEQRIPSSLKKTKQHMCQTSSPRPLLLLVSSIVSWGSLWPRLLVELHSYHRVDWV